MASSRQLRLKGRLIFMLALFSRFVRWSRPDGVRALKPLRRVVKSELFWTGNPHKAGPSFGYHFRRELLECGHTDEFRGDLRPRKKRRCFDCANIHSANEHKPQPVETAEKSAKNKGNE
jgi:hypothetical protein